jgi:hypothetical protein
VRKDDLEQRTQLGVTAMLAEKFILLLEAIRMQKTRDDSVRVVSTSPHIPFQLSQQLGIGRSDRGA